MERIETILSIAGAALTFLITALTFFVKYIKSAKAKRVAEQIITIGNAVLPYISKAETFVNYSGQEKKEYVLTKANQFAFEHKIPFNAKEVGEKIEELVALTKSVNSRDKDKICTAISSNANEYTKCMNNEQITEIVSMPEYSTKSWKK